MVVFSDMINTIESVEAAVRYLESIGRRYPMGEKSFTFYICQQQKQKAIRIAQIRAGTTKICAMLTRFV